MAFPFSLSIWVTEPSSLETRDPELHYVAEYADEDMLLEESQSTAAPATKPVSWRRRLLSAGVSLVGIDLVLHRLTGQHIHQMIGASSRSNGQQDGVTADDSSRGVERTLTIGVPPAELYRLWRQPDALSQVMSHVGQVTENVDGSHHWVVTGPLGQTWEWDTRIVAERPGELIRWESVPGAAISNAGEIRFRPGPPDWGTETTLHITASLPWGIPGGKAVLKLVDPAPQLLLGQALHRFKSLAETGEIPTLFHQPAVRDSGRDS